MMLGLRNDVINRQKKGLFQENWIRPLLLWTLVC
jgi:hypothetical protein